MDRQERIAVLKRDIAAWEQLFQEEKEFPLSEEGHRRAHCLHAQSKKQLAELLKEQAQS